MAWRGSWDKEKIRNNLIASEVDQILQIPLPGHDMDDVIIWGPDKKEIFSVKSTYHLGMQMSDV